MNYSKLSKNMAWIVIVGILILLLGVGELNNKYNSVLDENYDERRLELISDYVQNSIEKIDSESDSYSALSIEGLSIIGSFEIASSIAFNSADSCSIGVEEYTNFYISVYYPGDLKDHIDEISYGLKGFISHPINQLALYSIKFYFGDKMYLLNKIAVDQIFKDKNKSDEIVQYLISYRIKH